LLYEVLIAIAFSPPKLVVQMGDDQSGALLDIGLQNDSVDSPNQCDAIGPSTYGQNDR
jgi:hypothetical protein